MAKKNDMDADDMPMMKSRIDKVASKNKTHKSKVKSAAQKMFGGRYSN